MSGRGPDDSRPLAEGARLYETDRSVAEYLEFHYGPECLGVPNFPTACAEAAVAAALRAGHAGRARCLDVGCAVGRSSFELARDFLHVDAVDFSHRFIEAASRLAREGRVAWHAPTEGLLSIERAATVPTVPTDRVRFLQGDACKLAGDLSGYDLVLAANLIDRLHDPAGFLSDVAGRIVPGGVLAITSPYTWLEAYTPIEKWIGGKLVDGRPISTFEGLTAALCGRFELIDRRDLPFVIRETAHKHQHTIAEFTAWRRR